MKIVDALLAHAGYQDAQRTIEEKERTRRFCRHGSEHALDVARILWILVLENHRDFDKETVYLTALLHDIGRSTNDAEHDRVSAEMARKWLLELGASDCLINAVCAAIGTHRSKDATIDPATASLGDLLALADKKSRPCYRCAAASDCYWPADLKNHQITY